MNEILAVTAAALIKNNMEVFIVENAEQAKHTVELLIPEGATVAMGGSVTLSECGVDKLLDNGKYIFLDRSKAATPEQATEIMRKGLLSDYFLCSSNAVTVNGELINVDGRANRCAAIMFGPKNVIMVVGANKIVENVAAGIDRVKTIAAPKNAKRLDCKTYCEKMGVCMGAGGTMTEGCNSPGRICCQYVVSAYQREKNRIKVILCEEPLGY